MLKIENVDFSYGASKILFELSMLAKEGSVTCILGRNGVGKSTLLKTIMGIEKSQKKAELLIGEALGILNELPFKTDKLESLCELVIKRKN